MAEVITDAKHFPDKATILELFFVGYFKQEPFFEHVAFHHANQIADFRRNEQRLTSLLYGSEIVRRAMYDNDGCAIPNSPFAEHIQEPVSTLDDAERYVKGYIEACSSPLALKMDETICKFTGGHIHTAEIKPSGFNWRIPPVVP